MWVERERKATPSSSSSRCLRERRTERERERERQRQRQRQRARDTERERERGTYRQTDRARERPRPPPPPRQGVCERESTCHDITLHGLCTRVDALIPLYIYVYIDRCVAIKVNRITGSRRFLPSMQYGRVVGHAGTRLTPECVLHHGGWTHLTRHISRTGHARATCYYFRWTAQSVTP